MTEFKTGTCSWCNTEGEVYADNSRCEDCDNDVVDCLICGCAQHLDSFCRHISEGQHLDYFGSGVGAPHDGIRESFFRLLDAMPRDFAPALRRAIRAGAFHTWMVAPIIGGGGFLELYGMPARGDCRQWGDFILKAGDRDDAEDMHDGYRWLVSLFDKDTLAANRITIGWIDRWISERPDELGRWADDGGHARERSRDMRVSAP